MAGKKMIPVRPSKTLLFTRNNLATGVQVVISFKKQLPHLLLWHIKARGHVKMKAESETVIFKSSGDE